MSGLKGDLINRAYFQLRISGLTLNPSPEENQLALDRLESTMAEFRARNICVDYAFENTPDLNTPHNIERDYWFSIEAVLAFRLCADFGKTPPPTLVALHSSSVSFLHSATSKVREIQYPSRHPRGSGNSRRNLFRRFYHKIAEVPLECASVTMSIDDIDNFVENFNAYLVSGETIASYTIEANTGLTIVSDSLSSPNVLYQIEAVGGSSTDQSESFLQVKIVATTSAGRIETRLINFEIIDTSID